MLLYWWQSQRLMAVPPCSFPEMYNRQPGTVGRKGSTASLSQIEDQVLPYHALRPTMSSQSLARLETASVSSASLNWGEGSMSPGDPRISSPGPRAGTLPGRSSRKNSRQKVCRPFCIGVWTIDLSWWLSGRCGGRINGDIFCCLCSRVQISDMT